MLVIQLGSFIRKCKKGKSVVIIHRLQKILHPFALSFNCEAGFSAMVGIKSKFRNKLQLLNSLSLKLSHIDVDVSSTTELTKIRPILRTGLTQNVIE